MGEADAAELLGDCAKVGLEARPRSPISSGGGMNSRWTAIGCATGPTPCCAARWNSIETIPTSRRAPTASIISIGPTATKASMVRAIPMKTCQAMRGVTGGPVARGGDPGRRHRHAAGVARIPGPPAGAVHERQSGCVEACGLRGAASICAGSQTGHQALVLLPDPNSLPMWFFDLCNVETADRETVEIAGTTLSQAFHNGDGGDAGLGAFQTRRPCPGWTPFIEPRANEPLSSIHEHHGLAAVEQHAVLEAIAQARAPARAARCRGPCAPDRRACRDA